MTRTAELARRSQERWNACPLRARSTANWTPLGLVDRCLQLFGGYGYMREYLISRLNADARVQRIYGGANEIMKHVIARSL